MALLLLLAWGGCTGDSPRASEPTDDAVASALDAVTSSRWAHLVEPKAELKEGRRGWSRYGRRAQAPIVEVLAPLNADGEAIIDGPVGQALHIRAEGRQSARGVSRGNAVVYTDVAEDTDVVVALANDGFEELVVWHEPSAAQTLRYEVSLPAGARVVDEAGTYVVFDGRGRHFVRLAAPKAADVEGRDVPVTTSFVQRTDTAWSLELTVSIEGVAFPVVIDPAWTHGPGFPDESIVGFTGVNCDGCNEIHGDVAVIASGGLATIGDGVQDSTVSGSVEADNVVVRVDSVIAETVSSNQLTLEPGPPAGQVYGSHYTPLTVPLPLPVPTIPSFTVGNGVLNPSNAPDQPLPPGNYGDLEVGDGEEFDLGNELYTFSSITMGEEARLTCPSLCEIRVAGRVSIGGGSLFGTEGEESGAGAWVFVLGTDGTTKAYDAAEESTTRARVFAPNGTIHFHGTAGDQFGTFVGESVYLGEGQTINGTETPGEPNCSAFCAEAIEVGCAEISNQQECEDACNADLTGFCSAQARWWVDCFNESANEIYCQDDVAMKASCQAYQNYFYECSVICEEAETAPTACRTNYCECSPSSCPGYSFTPFASGVSCEDGDLCNGAETCDAEGSCASGTPVNPDDGNPCTIDSCDPQTGLPVYTNVAAGTSCDTDSNVCNGVDACDGLGHCLPGIAPEIDDGIPCTTDSCHPTSGVSHVPKAAGTSCDDGDLCNGAETCDGTASASSCTSGPPLLIDDGNACTIETCDPATGTITTATCNTDIDLTVATDVYTGNQFLIGTTQQNVTASFDPRRATVIRGLVTDRAEASMGSVRVSVMNHPEYGHTFTQPNGEYALMVNGGGQLTVQYDKEGYAPVQRTLFAHPLDYTWADDAIMTPLDKSTVIDTTGNDDTMQVVLATPETDSFGPRQAVLMVRPGTTASLLMPNQSVVSQSSLTIRVTEFTVGDEGPRAMPGDLPPRSRYTYAAEFSADEAIAAGAEQVQFSQPVIGYLDNFYGFPVGVSVPVGLYDRTRAAWEATRDGIVLEIVGIDGDGRAEVDTDGNGADDAALLAAWGISDDERTRLAQLYPVGKTLWRAELAHFTPSDWNWPPAVPFDVCSANDAQCPLPFAPGPPESLEDACPTTGSTIECENQALGQRFPIAGSPFDFVYRSDQTYDFARMRQLRIPIGPPLNPLPSTLAKVDAYVYVAGLKFKRAHPSMGPSAEWDFDEWDGTDYLGRPTQGPQPATVALDYWFWVSCSASQGAVTQYTFASWGGGAVSVPCYDHLHQQSAHFQTTVGGFDAERLGLGGLRVDAQHAFAPTTKAILYGDGSHRTSEATMGATSTIIQRELTTYCDPGSGVPALPSSCGKSVGVDVGPDGSVYFVGSVTSGNGSGIRRVDPDGNTHLVAGGTSFTCGSTCSTLPGPASSAEFADLTDIEVDGDGNIFVVDQGNNIIVRIDAATQWADVVAGQCNCESQLTQPAVVAPDGTAAKDAELNTPGYLVLAPDGSVVFSEDGRGTGGRIRIVYPNGLMGTVMGGGSSVVLPADPHGFYLDAPRGVAVGPDGSVYAAASNDQIVVRANPGTNKVELVAGTLNTAGASGDGGPATSATLYQLQDLAVAPNGDLYLVTDVENVSGQGNNLLPGIRKVSGGVISTLAGTNACGAYNGICGDGELALHAKYESQPKGIAVAPDGTLYLAASMSGLVRIAPPVPNLTAGHYLVPDRDGVTVFEFDGAGRHLKTIDSILGIDRLVFNYETTPNNQTYLKEIVDHNGHKTTFDRNAAGELTKVTGPFGHETVVTPNGAGRAGVITNPEQEATTLTYATATSGLLTTLAFPKGNTKTYAYDTDGLLLEANDAVALAASKVFKTFALQTWPGYNSRDVTLTTAEGVETGYEVVWDDEVIHRTVSHPAGFDTQMVRDKANGSQVTSLVDGTTTTVQEKPDPRFGMGAPHHDVTIETGTGGNAKSVAITTDVTATGLSVANPLALDTLTQSTTVGGRTHTTTVDTTVSPVTVTSTSHAGRQVVTSLDGGGRTTNVAMQSPTLGLVPLELEYYSNPPEPGGKAGYLRFLRRTAGLEVRETELLYDASGNLATIHDPLGRTFSRSYDGATRLTQELFPDLTAVGFDHDANGFLDELAQPGSPQNPQPSDIHTFEGNAVDLLWKYIYPGTGAIATRTTEYTYNLDRQLEFVTMPEGSIDYVYESSPATGRLHKIVETWPAAQIAETTTGYYASPDPREGKVHTLTYDAVLPANDVVVTFDYDGQMLTSATWSGAVAGSVSYGYDAELRIDSMTYGGGTTSYVRADADGLLTGAGDLVLTRDPETGLLTKTELTSTSTVTEDYGYDAFGEVDAQTYTHGATNLLDSAFARDALGRVTCETETVLAQAATHTEYVYDDADRLWKVSSCPGPCDQGGCTLLAEYQYDANGNRDVVIESGTASAGFDADDRITHQGSVTYTHDDNGSRLTRVDGAGTSTYTYDLFSRLHAVTMPGPVSVEYAIDALGRRVAKSKNSTLERSWIYLDGLRIGAETDHTQSPVVTSRFVYGSRPHVPDYMEKGGDTYRLVTDQLGSVRLVVDVATGNVAQRIDYDAWGNPTLVTGTWDVQPFGFAGGLYDPDTGLYRFGARDYDPEVGRWTSKDPIMFSGGINVYEYAASDPINLIDPTGLDPWSGDAIVESLAMHEGMLSPADVHRNSMARFWGGFLGLTTLATVGPSIAEIAAGALELAAGCGASGGMGANAPGIAKNLSSAARTLPSNARSTTNAQEVFRRLQKFNGISPELASDRLHAIKSAMGFGGADNVLFDLSGGVYHPTTRLFLGSLTEGGAKL